MGSGYDDARCPPAGPPVLPWSGDQGRSSVVTRAHEEAVMLGWVENIEKATLENKNFRNVVFTGKHAQVVLMRLAAGEAIGWEMHPAVDQFFRVEKGKVRIDLGAGKDKIDEAHGAGIGFAFVIPAGTYHNVTNVGKKS